MSDSSYAPPIAQSSVMDPETWARLYLSTASHRERFCALSYNHSLLISCGLQILVVLAFLAFDPYTLQTGYTMNATMSALLIPLQFLQTVIVIAAHIGMLRELVALYVRPTKIWNIYMTSLLWFGAIYFSAFAYDRSSFNVDGYAPSGQPDSGDPTVTTAPDQDVQTYNDVPTIFIFFIYFSGAIMTSTGFGDIAPAVAYTEFLSNAQMLLGTVYHVGVFGLTLAHFRTFQKMTEEERKKQEADPSLLASVMTLVESLKLASRIRRIHPRLDQFRRLCVHHLAIFSIVFQLLVALLMFAIPGSPFDALTSADGSRYQIKMAIISLMIILQFALFVTVLLISFRLVKSINNKELTANFLVQSYIATALLFGGIYFILFAATPHHQFSRQVDFSTSIFSVLYIFIHFSLTVMTTTGFGDIYARGVIARMFVLVQMLVSILYNAVIIGLGTSQLIDIQSAKAEQLFQEEKLKLEALQTQEAEEGEEDGEEENGEEEGENGEEDEDPFDREAAARRREERRRAGGDHVQVMEPSIATLRKGGMEHEDGDEDEAQEEDEEEDVSESHMFGRTQPGQRDVDDDGEAEELDMKTYGSIDQEDELDEEDEGDPVVADEHEPALLDDAHSRSQLVV